MPTTSLNIPVLVNPIQVEGHTEYSIRPVFLEYPALVHRRYGEAVTLFKREIRQRFSSFILSRRNLDNLLWFKFSPELQLHPFEFEFSIGTHYIRGLFHVITFHWHGMYFGLLPSLGNHMFIVSASDDGPGRLEERTLQNVKTLIKQFKKNQADEFNPSDFYSDNKAFITNIRQEVTVKDTQFNFEERDIMTLFSKFRQEVQFDGGEEIEKVGVDLCTAYPEDLKRAYFRHELTGRLYELVFKKENTPLVLLGKEGVGRHTLISEVVYQYMEKEGMKEEEWKRHHFWHINPNRIIAGMSIVGQWEKRFESILNFAVKPLGREKFPDKLLFDNPVALLRIGRSAGSTLTLSNVLKPYLEKRKLQVVLIATTEEWKIIQETDRAFSDLFQVIRIPEPDLPTAMKIVLQNRWELEVRHECKISVPAVSQLFTIQRNFLKNKALPGSVMRLLTRLSAKYVRQKIDAQEVRQEFKTLSGLEERIFDEQVKLEDNEVRKMLESELIGQPETVSALANTIHMIKARLTDRNRPLASFLFIGPTGVGKTHAAKLLNTYLMGQEGKLMRFDMNEYIDEGAVHRLIGDANNPEGQLTGKVRYQPFGVVLLDEIEKAHPKIHDLLLQVLDDARLTDSLGRTVDFSNTVIIMTSNLGAREAASQLGFQTGVDNTGALYRKAVENFFRPEMINRIEKILIFNPLDFNQIQKIAQLQIKELLQRDGFVRRTTIVNVSPEALRWVAKRGFDAKMGGRALKRQIERDLTLLSAKQLVRTTTDTPVILDISLEDDHLYPDISPLTFCDPIEGDWLPKLPDEKRTGRYFNQLYKSVEKIEARIAAFEQKARKESHLLNVDKESADWHYFGFKERVAELKEDIRFKQLKYKERRMTMSPVLPFRLKRIYLGDIGTGRARKEALRDKFFQTEALRELREEYRLISPQFDSVQTDYLMSYIEVAFLTTMLDGFLTEKTQHLVMKLNSCVSHSGQEQLAWLMDKYDAVLEKMDLNHTIDTDTHTIRIEGHNILPILQGENGIHLFYISHHIPVPIQLLAYEEGKPPQKHPMKVIRVYDGTDTLTDLRTGYSNALNLTPDEFKLLLFGGVTAR